MALPEPGTIFESRYRLDEVLGAGGFATVYRGTDTAGGRVVAIKVLRPDPGGYPPSLRARFEREVRIVGNLRDQHTVTMFDHGLSSDGLLFMVTEYVDGQDLEELLTRRGNLEPREVIHILRQVLTSLEEAHNAGLIHRDIKPSNIRLYSYMGDDLCVKVLDFGIAKELDDDAKLTAEGELVGSIRYMSPEQLMSEPLGPPSDIYSLGLVAFELLLGSGGIHGGALHDQLDRLVTSHMFSVPELQRLGPLATTLDRMTARHAQNRFQTAAQTRAALDARPAPSVAPPTQPGIQPAVQMPPPREHGPHRHKLVGASVVVGLMLLLVAFVVANVEEEPEPRRAVANRGPPSALLRTAEPDKAPVKRTVQIAPAADVDSGENEDEEERTGCGQRPNLHELGRLHSLDGDIEAFIPAQYDPDTRTPLVVMLPESGDGPRGFIEYSGMQDLAREHNFVLIALNHPEGGYAWRDETLSVRQVARGIDVATRALCIDMDRVFFIGHGSGGRGVEYAAAAIPQIRAVATTSYRFSKDQPRPTGPWLVPHLLLAPLKDGYNKVEGGTSCNEPEPYVSLQEQDRVLRTRHSCKGPPRTWFKRKRNTCRTWSCEEPYVSCHLDGGRNWPGQPNRLWDIKNCDGKPASFPFAKTIWKFFEEQSPKAE